MSTVIVGLFKDHDAAAGAIHTLEFEGVRADQISLVAGDGFEKETFAVRTHTKMPEGVAVGATTGAAAGAIVAGLTAVGVIATGGLGLIAAGPIVAALAGAGAGAAGGSILGGLVGLAIPEHEIKHYEDAVEKGAVLVGVDCKDKDQRDAVKEIFERFDAEKISHA